MRVPVRGLLLAMACLLAVPVYAQGPVHTPRVHALTNVRIVQGPGQVIEKGTVVLRDGVIEAVGASVEVPADARVWEADSLTVYPGLIDLAMVEGGGSERGGRRGGGGESPEKKEEAIGGLGHDLDVVTPEAVLADGLALKGSDLENRRAQGITTARVLPGKGTFRGQAAVVNLGDGQLSRNVLRRSAGQVLSFKGGRGEYPSSTMGVVAVIRQTLYDTGWYREAHAAYAARPVGMERPPVNAAFEALVPALEGTTPIIFVTENVLDMQRASEMGREFDLRFEYLGSGEEYKRLGIVRDAAEHLVIPVNFPEAPAVDKEGAALDVSLEKLRAWDSAPANPARLHEAGVPFALTANGLKDMTQFRKNVAKAIEAGLPADAALAAVTTTPASFIGMSDRLGTVETGKIANLVVTDGDLFAEKTKVRAVWIDGGHYEVEEIKPPKGDPRGTWKIVATVSPEESYPSTLKVGGEPGSLTATITLMGTEIPASITHSGSTLIVSFPGDGVGLPGTIRFSLDFEGDSGSGSGKSPDGDTFSVTGTRTEKPTAGGE